jgi:hypothetical protein
MELHRDSPPGAQSFLRGENTAAVLQRGGYKVVTTDQCHGSDLLRTGGVQADVVITNTPEAFLPFAEDRPMLYIAASPDPDLALRFQTCRVLRKPFRYEDLLEAVEELAHAL